METTAEAVRQRATPIEPTDATDRRRSPALGLMVAGLAVIALAVGMLATTPRATHQAPARPLGATAPAAPAAPGALTIQSVGDISVLYMTYEPGKSSGWHTHRGIHAVAVISGQLTVYEQDCVAHTYGPGEAYIGGQMLHLVRNEGAEPATMVVTYVNPIQPTNAPAAAPTAATTPPPCDVR